MIRIVTIALVLAACSGGPSQADGDRACQSAPACRTSGDCWYRRGASEGATEHREIANTGVYEDECEPRSDADCERSERCTIKGISNCTYKVPGTSRAECWNPLPLSCQNFLQRMRLCISVMRVDPTMLIRWIEDTSQEWVIAAKSGATTRELELGCSSVLRGAKEQGALICPSVSFE